MLTTEGSLTPGSRSDDPLLQPFQLKGLKLRNRIMSTSHAAGLGENGMPAQRYQDYHVEKARGGLGLTMFGGSSNVSIDSPSVMPQLNMGVDAVVPYLQQFSERVHAEGAAIMCQITHLGRRGEFDQGAYLPTPAPSVVRETLHRSIPREMDDHDIARIIADFARAAERCKEGGLDGIECLSGAHLIGQFLSPAQNFRTDGYGGSLENRCRFGLEVFEAIRKAVGDDFLVGFRFIVDEGYKEGLDLEQSLEVAKVFQSAGHIDFFNAIYGRMDTFAALAIDNMPGMASPDAPWLNKAAAFKAEIRLPVFHAARISDVATARHAITEGLIDLVGMTRAHIADPYLVAKIAAGEEDRIRPCVGTTHCMGHMRPTCVHNPASGHEAALNQVIQPADKKRTVAIVGAGPAGLEAARVCGERGHRVTVLEAAPKAGGQVLLAAGASWRKNLIGIVDWRVGELEQLGVDIRYNVYADEDQVTALNPDLVIIATGGVPNFDRIPGHELITSSWEILDGTVKPAGDVLVVDGTGRHVALSAADTCHRQGSTVRLVTIDSMLAAEQTYSEQVIWRKWARENNLPMHTEELLIEVRQQGNRLAATFRSELTGQESEISAGQVIFDGGTYPADELFHGLRQRSSNDGVTHLENWAAGRGTEPDGVKNPDAAFELHRIGDALSSRNIHAAVNDALRLCQAC
ncbi:oxidoreductase [Anderseniella sp. Alg231-50]|uniref:oxidoreductase n=1 Tax=Anderseniella sp. Alg231-50 TaxID=1922226 RepID=UPI000D55A741